MVKSEGVTAVTGAQLRAARALLGMRAEDLAQESKVSLRTIRRAEAEDSEVELTAANLQALIEALKTRGIEFLVEKNGLGVLLTNNENALLRSHLPKNPRRTSV